jgi:hypothetical protein
MKKQSTKGQRNFYIILTILTSILILNFFSFGFIFALLFNLSPAVHVVTVFASLIIGCFFWADIETYNEDFK